MNKLNFSVAMYGNPNATNGNKKQAHACIQINDVITMEDFAEHIASHSCKYDRADVYSVIYYITRCLKELVLNGNKVQFGDLGTFSPAIRSTATDTLEDFTSANIKGVTINWEKPEKLKNMIGEVSLQQVSTRAAQAASLKAEKEGKTSANWEKADNPSEGDSAVTPDEDNNPSGGDSSTGNGGGSNPDPNA